MNASYVTVSIPLLLLLAGFNHAHGLTTFGKSSSNNQQNTNIYGRAKQCTIQSNCTYIKNTTCLRGSCLCGDNHPPINGDCASSLLGPNHLCTRSEDCVDNAECMQIKDLKLSKELAHLQQHPEMSICRCEEGYGETGATCGGEIIVSTIQYLLFTLALCKIFY